MRRDVSGPREEGRRDAQENERSRTRSPGVVLGLLVLATLVALSVVKSDSPVATMKLHTCELGEVAAECGTLSVPEDRTSGTGRTIELQVAVVPAIGERSAPDPVFFLSGGPGGAAIEDAPGALNALRLANQDRDIVFVDQRGTGGSNELKCPYSALASGEDDVDELAACLAELPDDPAAYTTAWAMDDLDGVREALGYHTINLYGGSYGATAAQIYVQRYPQRVRTMTLIAGTPVDVPLFEWWPRSSQQALDRVFARCAADPRCRAAYPDPQADLDALAIRLEDGPVQLPLADPHTGEPVLLTRELLGPLVHLHLNGAAEAAVLPRWLHATRRADWHAVADLGDWLWSSDTPQSWQVMNLTILCHEPWAQLRRAETEALGVGSYLTYEDMRALTASEEVCAVMPRPAAPALYDPPEVVEVPVLAINGEADPNDPPELSAGLARHYPDSRLLVAANQSHWSGPARGCFAAAVAQFIDTASVDAVSPGCLASFPSPPFDVG